MPAPRKLTSSSEWRLRAASAARCSYTSCSAMPAGRSSSRVSRTRSGMSANSSSIEEMPIAASISRRSSSVTEVYVLMAARSAARLAAAYVLTIGGSVHELVGLARLRQLDLDEPAVAVGVLVYVLRSVAERLVRLGDLARERRDDVGHRFDRLHLGVRLILLDLRSDSGRVEEHELTQLVLGEPCDAERGGVAIHPRPVVLRVVQQSVWVFLAAHLSLL